MKKPVKAIASVVAVSSLAAASALALYEMKIYLPGQIVNGDFVGLKKFSEVTKTIKERSAESLVIKIQEGEVQADRYIVSDFNADDYWPSFTDWLKREPIVKIVKNEIDGIALETMLGSLYTESSNAYIVFDETKGWQLVPEVYGNEFNTVEVTKDAISNDLRYIDTTQYAKQPAVKVADLQETFDKVSWLNDFEIAYASGHKITGLELSRYVNNYELDVRDEFLNTFLEDLSSYYDTRSHQLLFRKSDGRVEYIQYNTYGKYIDKAEELAFIKQCIADHKSVTDRVPECNGYDDFDGKTYIEVSIKDQHLWYYKDGELVLDTDIVTGTKGVHDTPTGVFYISECIPGKTLRGADYSTYVHYWMRLTNSGIGLHDAYWRDKFGNGVYNYNGSHGCINIPANIADDIYDESFVGIPVVVY